MELGAFAVRAFFYRSTDLSFSNSTGRWMSAGKVLPAKALCTHTLASLRLFGTGLHWIQKHSLPAPQAQIYPPADGHSTCFLQFMKLFLPSHLHCSLGFSKREEKTDFSMFNLQGMVFTLHRAKKENALVCECREMHPVSLQCRKVFQLTQTETFLSEGSQTGTFLGSTAGCLNSIYFTYGVLFANRHGFNAIDTSTGKQLYPTIDYQSHKLRVRN